LQAHERHDEQLDHRPREQRGGADEGGEVADQADPAAAFDLPGVERGQAEQQQ
jgi:hypothetical protein